MWSRVSRLLAAAAVSGVTLCASAHAQSLNWDGQTGGVFAPSATVAESPAGRVGPPVIAFHWINGGDVVSDHFSISLTIGIAGRVEAGVSRAAIASGEEGGLGSLFDRGFTRFHGKVRVVDENAGGRPVPAVSVGAIARWQQAHLEGAAGVATQNGDVYVAVTKTLPAGDRVAIAVTGGVKATNASLFGLAGNSPDWTARGFAAGSVALGERLELGAEFVQQPGEIEGVAASDLPATLAYFARIFPVERLSVDVALVRLAGDIAPGFDAGAESRLTLGVGYRF
jgi:hypothetical protein